MSVAWNIQDKIVFITGATDGVGKAVAEQLLLGGAHVVCTARDKTKGEKVLQELQRKTGSKHLTMLTCDLSSLAEVRVCADTFMQQFGTLHVLINNAGVMPLSYEKSKDGIELNFAVNYLAPALLTELLLPALVASAPARVIQVTSSMHAQGVLSFEYLAGKGAFDRYRSYASSKLALMLFTRMLVKRLQGSHVTLNSVHPGWVHTKLARGTLTQSNPLVRLLAPWVRMRSPKQGAADVVALATDPSWSEVTGAYVVDGKAAEPAASAQDDAVAAKLWDKTQEILAPYLQ